MNDTNKKTSEKMTAIAAVAAALGVSADQHDQMEARGVYTATIRGYKDEHKDEYLALFARLELMKSKYRKSWTAKLGLNRELLKAITAMEAYAETLTEVKHHEVFHNVVTTVGKNFALDTLLAGSAYTAAWYLGLMSSVSYAAGAVAADTMASHGGWTEAGATNAPAYSGGARKTAVWASASAGSKALSTGLVYTFTNSGTVKGCFLNSVSTIDGTTGTLLSAGVFTGGDQPVVSTNTLTVTYSLSM